MNGLKTLVVTMSLLILAGLCLAVYGIFKKMDDPAPLQDKTIVLPVGSVIEQVSAWDKNLVLHIKDKDEEYIYLIDPRHALIEARIKIQKGE